MKRDEVITYVTIASLFISCFIMFYIYYDYSHQVDKLEKDKSELQSKLNIKNAEIEVVRRDLEEAHEMAGVLFLESMAVTDSYNELKKQCKKAKR